MITIDPDDLPGPGSVLERRPPHGFHIITDVVDVECACAQAEAGISSGEITVGGLATIAALCDNRGPKARRRFDTAYQLGTNRRKRGI